VLPPIFVEQGGNQCAMIHDAHSPCRMEIEHKPVEWSACPVLARSLVPMRGGES
jgi:hypothetical protein